ncbi:hypothetical protein B5M47_02630 [candidate division CPR3 bacterium 4484_211]|uniref:Uncharacterized protein n=1 Tax=candidate division CPR3 bacterium 4484_211 TaxID=1968527 RepID=A0A1W9NXP6_UNCC3|nr:MAG: hypothetical protein B5M47_02630 [candidate division CPR3 bacterium 4484_211]
MLHKAKKGSFVMVVVNSVIIPLVAAVVFTIVAVILALVLIAFKSQIGTSSEGAVMIAGIVLFGSTVSIPLSLFPSYKLSLLLARWVEKRWGIEIENPKKLFFLSLLIPILLTALSAILSYAVTGT